MRGFFSRLKDIWVITGITVGFFILLEIFFRIYFLFSYETDPRTQADCYQDAGWVKDYYEEFNQCNTSTWEPYIYWHRKPFNGKYINIDSSGIRRTLFQKNPASDYDPLIRIFMFGGSALWGTGVRDEYTIPSLLGKELTKKSYHVEVTNYGESGYVSTQELIKLQLELRKGNVPDLVIFFDGANDIFSSLQQGKAGIPQNENNRRKEFNTLTQKKRSLLVFFESLKTLATMRFINQKFLSEPDHQVHLSELDLDKLAGETIQTYDENMRLLYALSKDFGFKSVFYWQPLLLYKNNRTDYESNEQQKMSWMENFIELISEYQSSEAVHAENLDFYNLSSFFENETKPVFIDWCHVGEYGNTLLAKQIANDVKPLCDSLLIKSEIQVP